MKCTLFTHAIEQLETDVVVLVVFDKESWAASDEARAYDDFSGQVLAGMIQSGEFAGKPAESVFLHRVEGLKAKRLLLMGAGKRTDFKSEHLRTLAGSALRLVKSKGFHKLALVLSPGLAAPEFTQAAIEGAIVGDYESNRFKTDPKKGEHFVDEFVLAAPGATGLETALQLGQIVGEGQNITRDLGNDPPNVLTPTELAARAVTMAKEVGLEVDVLDRDRMQQLGMGSLLAVAQGSAQPPVLIVLSYKVPADTGAPHLAIVGKAVTFDTGGISIKPSESMDQMKFDMCGGAAAIGAMMAVARLKPNINVTAYIPSVENMPGHNAYRPGDILTSLSGKTVEVLNTDAEGRLILIDAITYAKKQGCSHMVDLATLTGAIGVALGPIYTGLFCNDQPYLAIFQSAAQLAGEKMWPMPLDDEYKEMLKSGYADMPNIGSGRAAGAITAAMFLKEWVETTPWCHLDIASTAWINEPKPHLARGATGVGVRTLVHLVHELGKLPKA